MIGKVILGTSFGECIRYCLEDKASREKGQNVASKLQHHHRAEVLFYNQCGGDKYELTTQFTDVQRLSKRVEKPVLHMTLRLAPGDNLTNNQWVEAAQICTEAFGVADHQYLCVLHKDTHQPHIHIVANRIGFDGKAASDSNSYRKMAAVCRKLELQFGLKQVLSPRAFLPTEQRRLPRVDQRKKQLGKTIWNALQKSSTFGAFEELLAKEGIAVIKGRGIAFMDSKKMRVKGSEIGFPLSRITEVFDLKARQLIALKQEERVREARAANYYKLSMAQRIILKSQEMKEEGNLLSDHITYALNDILYTLLQPVYGQADYISPELLREAKKKVRRKL